MLRWTWKSVVAEPMSLMAAIASSAGAFLLVMMFEAIFVGESEQIIAYVRQVNADVWVMQRGVSNMHMATSFLPDWKVRQVRELPGVADVDTILYLNTVVEAGDKRWFSYIVGLDVPAKYAGPGAVETGRAQPAPGEAIAPTILADMAHLGIGDVMRVTDREFTIVGLSKGLFSMANSVIFVNKVDLEDIMDSLEVTSFMLVKAQAGVEPSTLAARIETQIDKVHALPAEQFLMNDKRMAMQMGVETIALMTVIGSVLAILLVAFTVYSQIVRQRRELAVAKALGVTNRALYASVVLQATSLTFVSVMLATIISMLLMPVATALIPAVTMRLTVFSVTRVAAIGLIVALVASIVPACQIARVDPVSALNS